MAKKKAVLPTPRKIDPIRLANMVAELSGKIKLAEFPRLMDMISNAEDEVEFALNFSKDKIGVRLITGAIKVVLALECQRCQCPVNVALELAPQISPIISESQVQSLPREYEPLITAGEPISLVEMLEEEILLGLPMVAYHPRGECPVELPDYLK